MTTIKRQIGERIKVLSLTESDFLPWDRLGAVREQRSLIAPKKHPGGPFIKIRKPVRTNPPNLRQPTQRAFFSLITRRSGVQIPSPQPRKVRRLKGLGRFLYFNISLAMRNEAIICTHGTCHPMDAERANALFCSGWSGGLFFGYEFHAGIKQKRWPLHLLLKVQRPSAL
jgi:hypothetical protein